MMYINAMDIFPIELLNEIQKYIHEGLIYIPNLDKNRKKWGSLSGQQQELIERNNKIIEEYKIGKTIKEISTKYFLSISSIYRILHTIK